MRTLEARFWEKVRVEDSDACWVWTASKDGGGYGLLWVDGRLVKAHIFAYKLLVGPIPPGLDVDHLCHNRDKSCQGGPTCIHRRCVNPDHLEAVPHRTNVLRGVGPTAKNAVKTECPHGHEYTPENTSLDRGSRRCRMCHRAKEAARWHHRAKDRSR